MISHAAFYNDIEHAMFISTLRIARRRRKRPFLLYCSFLFVLVNNFDIQELIKTESFRRRESDEYQKIINQLRNRMSDKVEKRVNESLLKRAIRRCNPQRGRIVWHARYRCKREKIIEIIQWLRDSSLISFNFLTSLCGMHFPDNKGEELGVVYHMHSFANNKRIRLQYRFSIKDPKSYQP